MPYNQQYLDWKAGKNGYDWVDCLNFILIGSAEATDAKLTTGEINKIKQINEITFSLTGLAKICLISLTNLIKN